MPQNQFRPFATGVGANTYSPADYASNQALNQGVQNGTADPTLANTTWRQSTTIAAMVAQFIADNQSGDVLDNGSVTAIETQFLAALRTATVLGSICYAEDQGTSDTLVAAPSPALPSYRAGLIVLLKKNASVSSNVTSAPTLNISSLGAVAIVRRDRSSLVPGDLPSGADIFLGYDGTNFRFIGSTASDITAVITAGYVQIGDTNYTIGANDRVIATSTTFTATRTWTFPLASTRIPGDLLVIADVFGGISGSNTLTLARAGSDLIDGATSLTLTTPYKMIAFRSDGVSKWTYDKPSTPPGNIVTGSGVSVAGDLPAFADTTGIHLVDSGVSASLVKFSFAASLLF